uniref:Putative LOV domain-containing protein n=1 Tax=Larrea tridentata TaxID=66636 RepID=A0A126X2D7_LARTR|nr:putative LOV domain-containing protein [Larrea tridentata]
MDSQEGIVEQSFDSFYSQYVREALDELPDNFTITDPSIPGHPIVFASRGFLKMVGYMKEEVVGRNGRIFQGPGTNRRAVMEIREAIREERAVQVNLLNYRKDGTPFWMLFHMSPVFNKKNGRVTHFVGVQVPIGRRPRRLLSDCVGNRKNINDDGCKMKGIFFGSCRREVRSDSLLDLGHALALDSTFDADDGELEDPCEANDIEKERAETAVKNIMSLLARYSQLTGKLVCANRCSLPREGTLNASLYISLGRHKQSFVLTDPHLPDIPIVYASDAFLKLTGYTIDEILGRNCRFLSGEDTDSSTLMKIKESIQNKQACTVRILNYRKDRSTFWNFLHISPVRNASGKIAYFVGVQIEEGCENERRHGLSPEMRQLSVVGAVKVAVRSLSMGNAGPSKT